MLNAAVMPTTHKTVRHQSRINPAGLGKNCEKSCARIPEAIRKTAIGKELRKKLRANPGSDQENGGERHAHEKFYLVMQQAAVVQEANDRQQRSAGEDADDLLQGRVVPRQQHG